MPGTPTRVEDLPETFPVFPLAGALLLPGGRLPLNIFEPRYLAMVEDALAAGRMFAMVQPDPARPAGPTGPALYRVGCLGRLVSFSETEDGRYLITLRGVARVRLGSEAETRRGYRRARGDFAAFAADLAPPPPDFDRPALLAALHAYFGRRGIQADSEVIERMTDAELITTLSMVCPFDPCEKQALLEAASPTERAATLLALLQMDIHAPAGDGPRGRVS
jgi:Lon protease-like protein